MQAHKYDIHECIMQVMAKERRLEREEAIHRRARIQVRSFQNEGIDREDQNSINIEDQIDISKHKTNLGYYSIPSEVWNTLSKNNKNRIKQFNPNLRKKRNQWSINLRKNLLS